MTDNENVKYQIPDAFWEQIKPLLPPELCDHRDGTDKRKAMEAILYVFRTGCNWESLPQNMGSGSTIYECFQKWQKSGLFQRMWEAGLITYDELEKMVWYRRG